MRMWWSVLMEASWATSSRRGTGHPLWSGVVGEPYVAGDEPASVALHEGAEIVHLGVADHADGLPLSPARVRRRKPSQGLYLLCRNHPAEHKMAPQGRSSHHQVRSH